MVVDLEGATVYKDGRALELTQREYDLICFLASQPGKVFSREALMEHVWNYEGYVGDVRAVDVAVRRLREKIEDDPASPKFILTKRGMGYLFGGSRAESRRGRPRGHAEGGTPGARRKFGAKQRISAGAIDSPRGSKKEGPPRKEVSWGADPASPKFILTKRGMGYLFGGQQS